MFASKNCFFVPSHRQITVFFWLADAEANEDAIATFTQLESNTVDHTLDVNGRELKLDLEILDTGALPLDELKPEWLEAITENIGRYMKQGVITAQASHGDIAVENLGDGVWVFTRGEESVTLDNSKYLPESDNQYWVAYTNGCEHCGDVPDFEFAAVKTSQLTVPDGVSLGEHLRPFVEAMEAELRAIHQTHSSESGLLSVLGHMPGFNEFLEEKLVEHHTAIYDICAGIGEVFTGENPDEVGGVRIDGVTVLSIQNNRSVMFDRLVASADTENNTCDIDDRLLRRVAKEIEDLNHIALIDITPDLFSTLTMDNVVRRAMAGNYQSTNRTEHQLYHTVRSVATPGKRNWWLRVLVNVWFMHLRYAREDVVGVMEHQVKELGSRMDVDVDKQLAVVLQLREVIKQWY